MLFYDLASECRFHYIVLVIQVQRIQCRQGKTKGMNSKKQGFLGTILEADYHSIPSRTCSSNRRKERRERKEEGWDKGNILIPKG